MEVRRQRRHRPDNSGEKARGGQDPLAGNPLFECSLLGWVDRGRSPSKAGRRGVDFVTLPKVIRGRAWKFGVNIDTDQIIPAKYAIYSLDEKELGKHAMEGVPGREGWAAQVQPGDILVAASNFGCGSSRDIAPVAVRGAGISLVIAASYPRIFFRDAINMGDPILHAPHSAEAQV